MKFRNFDITAMIMSLLLCLAATSCTPGFNRNGIHYQTNGKGVTVLKNQIKLYMGRIVIPDTVVYKGEKYPVTEIGEGAFMNCRMLTSITIPKTVKVIGSSAFRDCANLKAIHCQIESPLPVDNLTFQGVNHKDCRLIIPMMSGQSYASADEWDQFAISEEGSVVTPVAAEE
jgi:hypothetical protein